MFGFGTVWRTFSRSSSSAQWVDSIVPRNNTFLQVWVEWVVCTSISVVGNGRGTVFWNRVLREYYLLCSRMVSDKSSKLTNVIFNSILFLLSLTLMLLPTGLSYLCNFTKSENIFGTTTSVYVFITEIIWLTFDVVERLCYSSTYFQSQNSITTY